MYIYEYIIFHHSILQLSHASQETVGNESDDEEDGKQTNMFICGFILRLYFSNSV